MNSEIRGSYNLGVRVAVVGVGCQVAVEVGGSSLTVAMGSNARAVGLGPWKIEESKGIHVKYLMFAKRLISK